ncbi:hypothetical protein B0E43_02180 [Algoriphagus sp. A40]|nr:hypothetical protein B0E43_02180 [Algoriphagus sp. A40]
MISALVWNLDLEGKLKNQRNGEGNMCWSVKTQDITREIGITNSNDNWSGLQIQTSVYPDPLDL